jgi:cytochrome c oxidase subunit II
MMLKLLGLPVDASAHGPRIDSLIAWMHWLMLVLFVGWSLYFIYVLIRFRAGRQPVAIYEGTKTKFTSYVEVAVAVVEAILLVGFAIPAWANWVSHFPPESESTVIRVMAQQFAWNVHYPGPDGVFGRTSADLVDDAEQNFIGLDRTDPAAQDDIVLQNQLHLPVGKPVIIELSTRDVIHSIFLPQMRVKQDAIPGMVIPVHFTATMVTPPEARYPACAAKKTCWEIACAQLCGNSHYRMRGFYVVESAAEYQSWLAANAPKPPPAAAAPAAAEPAAAAPATSGATATGAE